MSHVVSRLRAFGPESDYEALMIEAANEIGRLRNALDAVEGWMQNLDAVERVKPTDPKDLNCSARDVARYVRASIAGFLR